MEEIKFYRYKGKNDRLYEIRKTAQGNWCCAYTLKSSGRRKYLTRIGFRESAEKAQMALDTYADDHGLRLCGEVKLRKEG